MNKRNLLFVLLFMFGVYSGMAQVGIGTTTPHPSALLDLKANDRGLLIPQVELKSITDASTIANGNVQSLLVYNTNNSNGLKSGYYYWNEDKWARLITDGDLPEQPVLEVPANAAPEVNVGNGLSSYTASQEGRQAAKFGLGGTLEQATVISTNDNNTLAIEGLSEGNVNTDAILVRDESGVLKTLKAVMPKFFFMPSVAMDVSKTNVPPVDLYAEYKDQFTKPMASSKGASNMIPTLEAEELEYHITYFDDEVFENVSVTEKGVLTYKVKENIQLTEASFMNIVFVVK